MLLARSGGTFAERRLDLLDNPVCSLARGAPLVLLVGTPALPAMSAASTTGMLPTRNHQYHTARKQPVTITGGRRVGHNGPVTTRPDPDAEWWTTTDVAAYLGVQVGTVSTYRKRGQMPAPDLKVGRTHMWRPERIIEWHSSRPRPGVGRRSSSGQDDGHSQQQDPEG